MNIRINTFQYDKWQPLKTCYFNETMADYLPRQPYYYNTRGWLTRINNPDHPAYNLFSLILQYQNPVATGNMGTPSCYNGNIAQTLWNDPIAGNQGYAYRYDGLNRLTGATYGAGSQYEGNTGHYDTHYSYDHNGNMSQLKRKRAGVKIDDLTGSYMNNGNRLESVVDGATTDGYVPNTGTYTYDQNGNTTYDPSRGINIQYNHLNLPTRVEFGPDDIVFYYYSTTGTKQGKQVRTWHTAASYTTQYSGSFTYTNNTLSSIATPAGRLIPVLHNGQVHWKTEYNLTDQTSTTLSSGLGNVRVVFAAHANGQPEVMQQTSYYPFGYTLQQNDYYASVTSENKNLYNGKELQDDVLAGSRLDWYDYGARMYEAALGRFSCIDPIADQFAHVSPYNYAENRPINCIDLWGLQALQVSAGARGAVPLLGPWGISANFEMGVILDINYDLLLYGTVGFGGSCGGALSVGLNATFYPTANNYKDLVGLGADLGVSTPYFLSGQGNVSFSDNGPKRGGTLSYGFPTLTAGSAAYADVTFTYLLSEPINIREVNSSALNQISQMMGISMQQARIILALMKTKIEKEEEKKWAENSVMLEGVGITAKRLDKTQTNNNRLQSKNTKSGFISPFQQGRTYPGDPGYQGSYWQAYDDAKNF